MASEDERRETLIEDFRPRLKKLITVDQVLDYIDFIDADIKEQIGQRAKTDGNRKAADLLITNVLKKPHVDGWFRAFVDALINGGCEFAADYVQKPPNPDVEAENDSYVQFIQLMSPTLLNMSTKQVCVECFSAELLTQDDVDVIEAETTNRGERCGARELLSRIVRRPPGWFSKFLEVLQKTEHMRLYLELTGGLQDQDNQVSDDKVPSTTDELPGTEVSTNKQSAGDENSDNPKSLVSNLTDGTLDESADLYTEENLEPRQVSNGLESLQSERTDSGAAGGDPETANIVLRDYQMEVAAPALEGKNIIVCLPTGSGKTRVAVYITKKHLDRRREEGRSGKVVVLVNKVPLVDQHYTTEFGKFLKHKYKVGRVSGDSQLKISFTEIVKKYDVIICTAKILENYLERSNGGEDEGVHLKDLTLIVIDECHHTQKGEVYNHIMMRYLKQKHKNSRLKKEQKETVPLPQILGLTASPGVGKATILQKAEEHILRICANLDAYKIMSWGLGDEKKELYKTIVPVEYRKHDPFGDVIKTIMNAIHAHVELNPTCDLGSQNYEQWVIQEERNAAKEENQKVRVCAEHLRQYNEGLLLNNNIRMRDAFSFLNKYHEEEMKRKTSPDDEQAIQITDTERFLFNLFRDKKEELLKLAEKPEHENKSLSELRANILHEFSSRDQARGIIFTKTRRSAIALSQWIQDNSKFADIGVKASFVIGAGDQSGVKPMTSTEQREVLNKFRYGEINVLVATTVAEEGLDIPDCNFVIRYGLVTNETAMIQAEGRGRAENSSYTVVDVQGSGVAEKESVNEYRKDMMHKAIRKISSLNQDVYNKQIMEYQFQAVMEERVRQSKIKKQTTKNTNPSEVEFRCRGCSKYVCSGDNVQIIENMHRVNVSTEFSELFIRRENTSLRERGLDYETNGFFACKDCGLKWGSMMQYRGIECPCLHVKNFVVTCNGKKISKCTKWNELAVKFTDFDYGSWAAQYSEEEDTE